MEKIYDLIIIGAGPAGITASVYAARKQLDILVLTGDIGGQAAWSGDIENYTGYQFITGVDLANKFEEHMKKYGITVKEKEEVVSIRKKKDIVFVSSSRETYKAKSAIVASGKKSKELGVPGEKEFKNKGLTYCATCDGPLFGGKDVAIIGGGNSALDAALQLIKIAKKVFIINNTPQLGGDPVMRDKVIKSGNVTVINSAEVISISGSSFVENVRIKDKEGEKDLPVQGIFVEIGLLPNSIFAESLEKNESGEIKVNCHNETNAPGIFAAGDVTNVPEKQIIIAAGEGAKATLSAFKYLSKQG